MGRCTAVHRSHAQFAKRRNGFTVSSMNLLRPFVALFGLVSIVAAADAPKIAAQDAAKLVAEGKAVLVDCREPAEWKESGVAAPAALLSKSDFDAEQKEWKAFLEKNKGKQILVYCRSGGRAGAISKALNEKGIPAANVGGLKDWTAAGLPTRKVDEARAVTDTAPKK
jgi:rhodanese-related sulfurtransferase